jgi:N-methylhydantoinase B/oxoprolinase/acetone carboxylase alpha subunit
MKKERQLPQGIAIKEKTTMSNEQAMIELNEQDLEQVNGAGGGYYYYPYPKEYRYDEKHLFINEQTAYSNFTYQLDEYHEVIKYY